MALPAYLKTERDNALDGLYYAVFYEALLDETDGHDMAAKCRTLVHGVRMVKLAEALDWAVWVEDGPGCGQCGRPLTDEEAFGTAGLYGEHIIYRCQCGAWWRD